MRVLPLTEAGLDDPALRDFTSLTDVDTVSAWAKANGLAGVHYWSLDRDTPCAQTTASSTCSSTSVAALGYTDEFIKDLG